MIVDWLVAFFVGLLDAVLSLIPDWSPDLSGLHTAFATIASAVQMMNQYFPVDVLGVCLGVLLATKAAIAIWHALVFVYDKFPFKAT